MVVYEWPFFSAVWKGGKYVEFVERVVGVAMSCRVHTYVVGANVKSRQGSLVAIPAAEQLALT